MKSEMNVRDGFEIDFIDISENVICIAFPIVFVTNVTSSIIKEN